MENTEVIIVGAGPSGLVAGLALARFRIKSIILEKEREITADPRGVYLTGDAIRILHDLGLGDNMSYIGTEINRVNFHQTSFTNNPFFILDIGLSNELEQGLPEGLVQMQPRLESVLREKVMESEWCSLRIGCEVARILDAKTPAVEYKDSNGAMTKLQGKWLIGADGKTGVVRKRFLEPEAGIKQENGTYRYDGTWVASNLKISLPTPETHPEFPLWKLGYQPQDVYDLYWPKGWHFCSPPGKATAAGRFGPYSQRLWRHEFREESWDDSKDAEALLWEHITPMITRGVGISNDKFGVSVTYPRDCIEVLRCKPFRFTHKVVNRWFHERVVLIGDAAHVFPPFAGQGIASGMRDAHQIAWRLALFLRQAPRGDSQRRLEEAVMQSWAAERRRSVDDAALQSMLNGKICNEKPAIWVFIFVWIKTFLEWVPFLPSLPDPQGILERRAFTTVKDGLHIPNRQGGSRLAQIEMVPLGGQKHYLSDKLLHRTSGIFSVLVLLGPEEDCEVQYRQTRRIIEKASLSKAILAEDSIVLFRPNKDDPTSSKPVKDPVDETDTKSGTVQTAKDSQRAATFLGRLGRGTRFAILRPDLFVFACATNDDELCRQLEELKKRVQWE